MKDCVWIVEAYDYDSNEWYSCGWGVSYTKKAATAYKKQLAENTKYYSEKQRYRVAKYERSKS